MPAEHARARQGGRPTDRGRSARRPPESGRLSRSAPHWTREGKRTRADGRAREDEGGRETDAGEAEARTGRQTRAREDEPRRGRDRARPQRAQALRPVGWLAGCGGVGTRARGRWTRRQTKTARGPAAGGRDGRRRQTSGGVKMSYVCPSPVRRLSAPCPLRGGAAGR